MAELLDTVNTIKVFRGESKTVRLTILDGDGQPVPLTGKRVILTVKRDLKDATYVLQKTSDAPAQIAFTAPDVGLLEVYFLSSDTLLDAGTYQFDVWLEVSPTERTIVIPPSDFVVERAVTVFLS